MLFRLLPRDSPVVRVRHRVHPVLQRGQRHLEEAYIGVYGGYGTGLLRLQLELIQALDRHRRGHKQTVEVRHVHIHAGAQGVVGIINSSGRPGSEI